MAGRIIFKDDGTIFVKKRTLVKCTQCGSVVVKTRKKGEIFEKVGRMCCPACGMGSIGKPTEFVKVYAIKPRK